MGRRGLLLTVASIAGQLSVFAILFASLRAVGVPASEVSLVEVFAAWSLVRLISAFPIRPGDLGIIEVGLPGASWRSVVRKRRSSQRCSSTGC
jgi:uncharacterized membrane protein YbhN (UPF0104 family)